MKRNFNRLKNNTNNNISYAIKEICIILKRLKQIHLTVNIYHSIFLIKIRQKFKNIPIVKKAQAVMLISFRRVLYNFKTIE